MSKNGRVLDRNDVIINSRVIWGTLQPYNTKISDIGKKLHTYDIFLQYIHIQPSIIKMRDFLETYMDMKSLFDKCIPINQNYKLRYPKQNLHTYGILLPKAHDSLITTAKVL